MHETNDIERPTPAASHQPLMRFAGKVVLITGASDRGLGGAIAERLAEEGAQLAMIARHEPGRLLKRLNRARCEATFDLCDVTDTAQVNASVAAAVARFGRIDALINNAGVEVAMPLEQFTDDQWQQLLDINLHGAIRVTRAVLPHFPVTGGAIVNVASALALGGCPSFSIYSAAKAGLIGLTQSLAWELAPRKIRVTAVAPALVATPMTLKHLEHLTVEMNRHLEAIHPLGVGLPHDVSGAVAFLASDDARWITGITLPLGWAPQYSLPVEQFMTPPESVGKPR